MIAVIWAANDSYIYFETGQYQKFLLKLETTTEQQNPCTQNIHKQQAQQRQRRNRCSQLSTMGKSDSFVPASQDLTPSLPTRQPQKRDDMSGMRKLSGILKASPSLPLFTFISGGSCANEPVLPRDPTERELAGLGREDGERNQAVGNETGVHAHTGSICHSASRHWAIT